MDKPVAIFIIIDGALLLALFIIKTFTFFTSTRKRSLARWFYFSKYDIFSAPSEAVKSARIKQNKLSIAILSVLLLSPILFFILALFLN